MTSTPLKQKKINQLTNNRLIAFAIFYFKCVVLLQLVVRKFAKHTYPAETRLQCHTCFIFENQNSPSGNRTRVCRVRTYYPDQLD